MSDKRVIVCLSGGKASAWCALWAVKKYGKGNVILYFNDTKWEHPDLYRFLNDVSDYIGIPITVDADGRSPEQLFYDQKALANNRMPFCSRILKSNRLQNFYKNGDSLVFGIGIDEPERAHRIVSMYQRVAGKTGKYAEILLPLVTENISAEQVDEWLKSTGIKQPALYDLGFSHNNCYGGCVRAGKKQWKMLYEKMPAVYADRERVEREFRDWSGKDVHFFKDETLEQFRQRIEVGDLSSYYDDDTPSECIGECWYQPDLFG